MILKFGCYFTILGVEEKKNKRKEKQFPFLLLPRDPPFLLHLLLFLSLPSHLTFPSPFRSSANHHHRPNLLIPPSPLHYSPEVVVRPGYKAVAYCFWSWCIPLLPAAVKHLLSPFSFIFLAPLLPTPPTTRRGSSVPPCCPDLQPLEPLRHTVRHLLLVALLRNLHCSACTSLLPHVLCRRDVRNRSTPPRLSIFQFRVLFCFRQPFAPSRLFVGRQ